MPGVNLLLTPGPANTFKVAGLALPGVAIVTGCVDQRAIDVQKGSGTKGATLVYKGGEPKPFKVKLILTEPEHYEAWLNGEAAKVVRAVPDSKTAKAYAVEHPSCLECGITAAVTVAVPQCTKREDGAYEVEIEMMPSSPPKPSSGTPKGSAMQWKSSIGGGGARPPDAQSEADREIEALRKELAGIK